MRKTCALAFVLVICFALPFAAHANLVANPGFDTGAAYSTAPTGAPLSWAPAAGANPWFIKQEDLDKNYVNWGLSTVRYVSAGYSSYALAAANARDGNTFISLRQNNIAVSPNTTYRLSFNYWSAGPGWIGTTAGANLQTFIIELDSAGNPSWPNTYTIATASGTWVPYSQTFTTQSTTAKVLLKFQLAVANPSTDKLYIDNVNISALPQVTITSPTADSVYETSASTINIAGTASSSGPAITSVTWTNSTGGSGTCTGTTSWFANGIALHDGDDLITVTVTDAEGTTNTDTLLVVPPLPVGPVITDNFSRVATTVGSLGTTAAPNAYAWKRGIYNGVIDPRVSIDGAKMILDTGPNCWSGVFIDGLLMRDFDATFTISSTYTGDAGWTAIQYRGTKPMYAEYQTGGDTAGDPAAYLLKFFSRSPNTTKYRIQIESAATGVIGYVDTNIDFNTPHLMRLKVVGNHHQVWVDNTSGLPLLDVTNSNNTGAGYFEVCRRDATTTFDGLSIQLHDAYGTVSGTVRNASNNAPVEGADVTILGKTATTNSSGYYSIAGLISGSWQMDVTADGYAAFNKTTTVVAGGTTTENVNLTPMPAVTITDTFSRPDNTELGTTEDARHCPWIKSSPDAPSSISYEALYLSEGGTDGVALGGGVYAGDLDLTANFSCGSYSSSGYAGFAYRCSQKAMEDPSGYSVRIDPDYNTVSLYSRGAQLATANMSGVDFYAVPGPFVEIRAIGNRHRVWVNGTKYIDFTDTSSSARTMGGFLNVIHNPMWANVDNFNLTAWGPALAGSITGTVYSDGSPVSGAEVVVAGFGSATTNGSGVYTVSDVVPGSQVVTASKPGLDSDRRVVSVPSGSAATQDFDLTALPAGAYADTFTRPDAPDLGTTEDASHTTWVESSAAELSIANHQLSAAAGGAGYLNAALQGVQVRNFEVTFDATLFTTENAYVGMMYRNPTIGTAAHDEGGYLLEFNPSKIYLWSSATGHIAGPDNPYTLGIPHRIKMRVENDRHQCWIDGTQVFDVTNTYNSTDPGYLCLFRCNGLATWDNFKLVSLDPPTYTSVSSVAALKALGDSAIGKDYAIESAVITTKLSGYCFYVEDANRANGIKVMGTPNQGVGDAVKVIGTVSKVDDELILTIASADKVTLVSTGNTVRPLVVDGRGLKNPSIGLSAVGLLVKVAGKVTAVDTTGHLITIDDGTGVSYRAWYVDGITVPSVGDIVIARGCAGRLGGMPVIWMFNTTDLRKVGP